MKNESTRKIINVDKCNYSPIWTYKQEDDGVLKLALFKGSTLLDITGQTIKLGAKRPDNSIIELTNGFKINKNELDIILKNNILAIPGIVECDLEITDAGGKMTTASFYLTINKKITGKDNLDASNDISAINKIVAEVLAIGKELDGNIKVVVEEANKKITAIDTALNKKLNEMQEDYDSLQKIMIDENQAANLQAQINKSNEQLDTKANKNETNNMQSQIDALVLEAVGDGNNAEVVQARNEYRLLNDRFRVVESGYKKLNFGYIDLRNDDFVNSTPNRIVTNGVPITKKGMVTVSYVPKQTLVYIQHLRYVPGDSKFIIIASMTVECRKDIINTTVCNFDINTSGYDYIAIEGLGLTTNDKSVGYLFLQDKGYGSDITIKEYNTPLKKVYSATFGYYVTVHQINTEDVKKELDQIKKVMTETDSIIKEEANYLDKRIVQCENSLRIPIYDGEEEQIINMISGGFWHQERAFLQLNPTWNYFWHIDKPIKVVPGEVYRIVNIGGMGNLHPILLANSNSVDSGGKPYIKWTYPDENEIKKTVYGEIYITIPRDVNLMYLNSHTQSDNSIEDLHLYKINNVKYDYIKVQDVITMKKELDQIKNLMNGLGDNLQTNIKANRPLSVYKNGKKVIVAYKYNSKKDMRIHFNDDNANGTPQLRGNEMFDNIDLIPSCDFSSNGNGYNTGKTDFVGPIICEAVENGDTNVNTDGGLHFTGGMHDINDIIGNGKPTAKNISMKVYIDGVEYKEIDNITTRCNLVKIIVQNHIMASNTVKLDGTGRCVINEIVEYTIGSDLKLNVKVTLEALENIRIYKYYGMQGNFKGYSDAYRYAQATYIVDDGISRCYTLNTDVVPKVNTPIRKVIIDDRLGNKAIMTLKNFALGSFGLNDNTKNPCAFNTKWSKVYFNLIRRDNSPLVLNKFGGILMWEGEYEFLEGKVSVL